ncbi:MAG: phenylacetate--CoA ligase, partial [Eubacteriales bacterium]
MAFHQEQIETMPRKELEALQSERLVAQVKRMYENVPVFRQRMDAKGLTPDDIHGIEDLHRLPFSYKQDLRDNYPYGLFATPMSEIKRVHASSGTTGKQIVVGYTQKDLDDWDDCVARMMVALDLGKEDFIQVSYGYGLFTGGLGAHGGSQRIGATTIPTSSGNTARQIQTMIDFGSTALCCTPSYALYLGEAIA